MHKSTDSFPVYFQPPPYLFNGVASVVTSVCISSSLSGVNSGGWKSILSVLGVLKPLHQPATFSLCLKRAVYAEVSLVITPIPMVPSGQTGMSTGPSSKSCTLGWGLSVGGRGDTGEWRRGSETFLLLEWGLGYLQFGGSKGDSKGTKAPSEGAEGAESCSRRVSCAAHMRWWKGIMAGLFDCLSAFSVLSLVLCFGVEGG